MKKIIAICVFAVIATLSACKQETNTLDKPNVTNQQLIVWTSEAITTIYSFNFVNYRHALQ
ncbi:unnamed protein product, partial [marine sediment metagenome]